MSKIVDYTSKYRHIPTQKIYEYDQVMGLWYSDKRYSDGSLIPENTFVIRDSPYFEEIEENSWISVKDKLPNKESYYDVKFDDGTEDQKPYRIRPKQNIKGFMTEKNVTHWRKASTNYEPID